MGCTVQFVTAQLSVAVGAGHVTKFVPVELAHTVMLLGHTIVGLS
jgi:hypothetical protein